MTKIVKVIHSMIGNDKNISNIEKLGDTFYFSYKEYIWAIWAWVENNDNFALAYHPHAKNISEAKAKKSVYISWNTTDFEPDEGAQDAFEKLHTIVKEKYYGLDKVYNDLLHE